MNSTNDSNSAGRKADSSTANTSDTNGLYTNKLDELYIENGAAPAVPGALKPQLHRLVKERDDENDENKQEIIVFQFCKNLNRTVLTGWPCYKKQKRFQKFKHQITSSTNNEWFDITTIGEPLYFGDVEVNSGAVKELRKIVGDPLHKFIVFRPKDTIINVRGGSAKYIKYDLYSSDLPPSLTTPSGYENKMSKLKGALYFERLRNLGISLNPSPPKDAEQ